MQESLDTVSDVGCLCLTYLYFQIPRTPSDHGGKNGTRHRTPCLYIDREFQRGEAPVVLPPAPNAFALSQNNKEASFMDYSFSTYLMWHLNASSIASYFNSAQVCCLPLTWFYILCLVFDFSGYQTNLVTAAANLYNMLHWIDQKLIDNLNKTCYIFRPRWNTA